MNTVQKNVKKYVSFCWVKSRLFKHISLNPTLLANALGYNCSHWHWDSYWNSAHFSKKWQQLQGSPPVAELARAQVGRPMLPSHQYCGQGPRKAGGRPPDCAPEGAPGTPTSGPTCPQGQAPHGPEPRPLAPTGLAMRPPHVQTSGSCICRRATEAQAHSE